MNQYKLFPLLLSAALCITTPVFSMDPPLDNPPLPPSKPKKSLEQHPQAEKSDIEKYFEELKRLRRQSPHLYDQPWEYHLSSINAIHGTSPQTQYAYIQELILPNSAEPTDDTFKQLAHIFPHTARLRIEYSNITNLSCLQPFQRLTTLSWTHRSLPNDGKDLLQLTNLTTLSLKRVKITLPIVENVSQLTHLSTLSLFLDECFPDESPYVLRKLNPTSLIFAENTFKENKDFEHLTGLLKLESLSIGTCHKKLTKINDDGLQHVKHLTNLRRLRLTETNVTEQGIANLRKSLPYLKFEQ